MATFFAFFFAFQKVWVSKRGEYTISVSETFQELGKESLRCSKCGPCLLCSTHTGKAYNLWTNKLSITSRKVLTFRLRYRQRFLNSSVHGLIPFFRNRSSCLSQKNHFLHVCALASFGEFNYGYLQSKNILLIYITPKVLDRECKQPIVEAFLRTRLAASTNKGSKIQFAVGLESCIWEMPDEASSTTFGVAKSPFAVGGISRIGWGCCLAPP